MLQLAVIRQHPEFVKARLKVKNLDAASLIDSILALDEKKRKLQVELEAAQSRLNSISKEIGQWIAKGDQVKTDEKKREVAAFKASIPPLQEKSNQLDQQLQDLLVTLPNLPAKEVPLGKTPEDNVVVRIGGEQPRLSENALAHWDLAKKFNLIDFELGNKLTGSGFPVYINKGARLQRAMIQYFLDYNTAAGFIEYQPPLMVNEASAFGTGQLPDKEGQMYFATEDKFYLIPTSEVPLTNIYRDAIVKENELPIRMTAYTPCFRREAGSYGKDVRGLNRLHQFDKVEIVQIVHPDRSYAVLDDMVVHVERLLQSLKLPYRILRLCGGDMSFASAITYDLEVFSAAQKKWLEVSSVTNFETFQTNRMKIRFKDEVGKMQLLHSLNGSSLALPRILACLLENNQQTDSIGLPEVIHDYFGAAEIKG
ncbi:MAG: serine--tRNA ligase [Bacteroidota bacterium]|nr:serine--tRNA ligase [Bacteroidota bacterium]MDP4211594.1 serine--tRNA ligase [Bacteroidota bacterium]MDP4249099.1 serine--tRNA ligase [Bacteroidota bacterium]